ncbi:MAG: vancomycin resistance protein [Ruminococcaceae bacterium]|nr:vancomycin resistance protein [Oscillospiraceae bacterium]
MERKLFCELSPVTYCLSVQKNILTRHLKDLVSKQKFAKKKSADKLPVLVAEHQSVIRRTLGNVDMKLQENKAKNLSLAAPNVNGILIRPGEVFSLWKLLGKCKKSQGYLPGVTISNSNVSSGVGGGMCQLSNLIHWMILHSPLEIVEHHHHDGFDLFPDCDRRVPFGTGTSIAYNYLDYRFKNPTDDTFQLCVWTNDIRLCGELRSEKLPCCQYEIRVEDECFIKEADDVYRIGNVYRKCVDRKTGDTLWDECIRKNHAKVLYDTKHLNVQEY